MQKGTWKLPSHSELPKVLLHPNYTIGGTPKRASEKNDTLWCWKAKHQKAFDAIKDELTKTPVLAYFILKADHSIQLDGSMKGLSWVLLLKGKPVMYALRALMPAETGYSYIKGSSAMYAWLGKSTLLYLQENQGKDIPQATYTHMEEVIYNSKPLT